MLQPVATGTSRPTGWAGAPPLTCATGEISFDLAESFPADKISALANFHSLFYYYGIACEQMP